MNTVRSADGTIIAFERRGDGPPLVLVGGALSDRRAAAEVSALLGQRFTVIAFDRRGRGDSGDTPPYVVEREIEDVAALVEEAGGSALLFGHSSGGVLSLRAVEAGLPVTKLAVYEPPFILDTTRPPLPPDYVEHLDRLVAGGRRGDAVAYFMTTGIGVPAEMVEQMKQSPMWRGLEANAHTIAYDGRVMGDLMGGHPFPPDRWSGVKVPTLVLDGGASPEWQRNAARALADALPDARYRTLEGQDHGPSPEVLVPALVEFFTS
ncbi:MAG: alpha/beta fold hydrolase [Actinomycetota bacterium]